MQLLCFLLFAGNFIMHFIWYPSHIETAFIPTTSWVFCWNIISCSFSYFHSIEEFLFPGWVGWVQYLLFLTLFILFDFWGLDKKGGTFDCFSLFFPKNEILISLLHVYYLVEHLVKEMDGLNNACVLDIVYFVEGNCSFLTNLFAVSYRSKPTTICVILMKKMRWLFKQ